MDRNRSPAQRRLPRLSRASHLQRLRTGSDRSQEMHQWPMPEVPRDGVHPRRKFIRGARLRRPQEARQEEVTMASNYKLVLSRKMLRNIRQQIEHRLENIAGFGRDEQGDYRAEIARLRRMIDALDTAKRVTRYAADRKRPKSRRAREGRDRVSSRRGRDPR